MEIKKFLQDILDAPVASPDNVDKKELKMGIEVEHEHSSKDTVAEKIALAHLREIPDYYTRLKKMEDEAKKKGDKSDEEKTSEKPNKSSSGFNISFSNK